MPFDERLTKEKVKELSNKKKEGKTKELVELNIESIERVKTGVIGLDELIEGGIPRNSIVLVSGTTGTGKSILGMQFLIEGALEGEPGVYVSLEEPQEKTIMQMKTIGFPIDKLIDANLLLITQPELYDFDKLMAHIEDAITKIGAKRLVIDPISLISLYFQDDFKVRRAILELERTLKRLACTTIAIAELREDQQGSVRMYGVEEFVVDGVIILYYIKTENVFNRALAIRKMRATEHSLRIHPLKISRKHGLVVYPEEEIFTKF